MMLAVGADGLRHWPPAGGIAFAGAEVGSTIAPAGDAPALREVVFIDADVEDAGTLSDSAGRTGAEVFVLRHGRDGIAQIGTVLEGFHDLEAIHLISHGSSGQLLLGGGVVDREALAGHAEQFAVWRTALAPGADILVYGCEVSAGVEGQAWVGELAALTGADVAASTTRTGGPSAGGDWVFETRLGSVEAGSLWGPGTPYAHTLDVINGGAASDTLNGTANADRINGFGGNDFLAGGKGDDVYVFLGNWGIDSVSENPASGADALDFKSITAGLSIEVSPTLGITVKQGLANRVVATNVEKVIAGKGPNDVLDLSQITAPLAVTFRANGDIRVGGLTFVGVESVIGGGGNDWFAFEKGARIAGTLDGGTGTNTLAFGDDPGAPVPNASPVTADVGVFLPSARSAADGRATLVANFVSGGVKNITTVVGGRGDDVVQVGGDAAPGTYAVTLKGGDGNDTLLGGTLADVLLGGKGDDTLRGDAGDDTLEGGEGDDTYVFADGWGRETFVEAASGGKDTLDFRAVTRPLTVVVKPAGQLSVTDDAPQPNTLAGRQGGLTTVERIVGGRGAGNSYKIFDDWGTLLTIENQYGDGAILDFSGTSTKVNLDFTIDQAGSRVVGGKDELAGAINKVTVSDEWGNKVVAFNVASLVGGNGNNRYFMKSGAVLPGSLTGGAPLQPVAKLNHLTYVEDAPVRGAAAATSFVNLDSEARSITPVAAVRTVQQGVAPVREVWELFVDARGGTYRATMFGLTTKDIPFDAGPSQIESILGRDLGLDVRVTRNEGRGSYRIEFLEPYSDLLPKPDAEPRKLVAEPSDDRLPDGFLRSVIPVVQSSLIAAGGEQAAFPVEDEGGLNIVLRSVAAGESVPASARVDDVDADGAGRVQGLLQIDSTGLGGDPGTKVVTAGDARTKEVRALWTDAASGRLTITSAGRTAAVSFDAAPADVASAFTNGLGRAVETVTGRGTPADPWLITAALPGAGADIQLGSDGDDPLRGGRARAEIVAAGHEGDREIRALWTSGDSGFVTLTYTPPADPGVRESWRLSNAATSGAFTLTYDGRSTVPLPHDASPGEIEAALNRADGPNANVSVVGVAAAKGRAWAISFNVPGIPESALAVSDSGFNPGTSSTIVCRVRGSEPAEGKASRSIAVAPGTTAKQLETLFRKGLGLDVRSKIPDGGIDASQALGTRNNPWVLEFLKPGPLGHIEIDGDQVRREDGLIQRLSLRGTAGAFELTYKGETTSAIPVKGFQAESVQQAAQRIQAALRALPSAGDVTVLGSPGADGDIREFAIDFSATGRDIGRLEARQSILSVNAIEGNRVQHLRLDARSGAFTLGWGASTTVPIAIDPAEGSMQACQKIEAALETTVGRAVTVTTNSPADPWAGVFTITFSGPQPGLVELGGTVSAAVEVAASSAVHYSLDVSRRVGSFALLAGGTSSRAIQIDATDSVATAIRKIRDALADLAGPMPFVIQNAAGNGSNPWAKPFLISSRTEGVEETAAIKSFLHEGLRVDHANLFLRNANASIERGPRNTVQTLSIGGVAGSFRLSYAGTLTQAIAVDTTDSPAAAVGKIREALQKLPGVVVQVTTPAVSRPWSSPLTITFTNPTADVAPLSIRTADLLTRSLTLAPGSASGIGGSAKDTLHDIDMVFGDVTLVQRPRNGFDSFTNHQDDSFAYPSIDRPMTHVISGQSYFSVLGDLQLETDPSSLTGDTISPGFVRPALLGFLPGQFGLGLIVAEYPILKNGRTKPNLGGNGEPLGADVVFTLRYERSGKIRARTITVTREALAATESVDDIAAIIQAQVPIDDVTVSVFSLPLTKKLMFETTGNRFGAIEIQPGTSSTDVPVIWNRTNDNYDKKNPFKGFQTSSTDTTILFGNLNYGLSGQGLRTKTSPLVITVDTSPTTDAGKTLHLDFRAETDGLTFLFSRNRRGGTALEVYTSRAGVRTSTLRFTDVDRNTIIHPGRQANTFVVEADATYAGRLVGEEGAVRSVGGALKDLLGLIGVGNGGGATTIRNVVQYPAKPSSLGSPLPGIQALAAVLQPGEAGGGLRLRRFERPLEIPIHDITLGGGGSVLSSLRSGFWVDALVGSNPGRSLGSIGSIGANTFTIGQRSGGGVGGLFVPKQVRSQLTSNLGVHAWSGKFGPDTYTFNTHWGVAAILEPPDIKIAGVTIPEYYDTLDFSGISRDLNVSVIGLTTANLDFFRDLLRGLETGGSGATVTAPLEVGMNLVIVTDGLLGDTLRSLLDKVGIGTDWVDALQRDYGIRLGLNTLVATDIENIVGSAGRTTVSFVNGGGFQGKVVPGGRHGSLALDYSNYRPAGASGVSMDAVAGAEFTLFPTLDLGPLGTVRSVSTFGRADAVEGNRFGGFEDLFRAAIEAAGLDASLLDELRNFAVSGVREVVGTDGADTLAGSSVTDTTWGEGTVFHATRGADRITGRSRGDTLDFSRADGHVVIDLALGKAYASEWTESGLSPSTLVLTGEAGRTWEITGASGAGAFPLRFGGSVVTVADRTAAALLQALSSIPTISNLTVSGAGTEGDPWIVRFDAAAIAGKVGDLASDGPSVRVKRRAGAWTVTHELTTAGSVGTISLLAGGGMTGAFVPSTDSIRSALESLNSGGAATLGNVGVLQAGAGRWAITYSATDAVAAVNDVGQAGAGVTSMTGIERVIGGRGTNLVIGGAETTSFALDDDSGSGIFWAQPGKGTVVDVNGLSRGPTAVTIAGDTMTITFTGRDGGERTLIAYHTAGLAPPRKASNLKQWLDVTRKEGREFVTKAVAAEASVTSEAATGASALSPAELAPLVAEAVARWNRAGSGLSRERFAVTVQDLPGRVLGQIRGTSIVIDVDAAGQGWFVDPTPADDEEFEANTDGVRVASATGAAYGRYDLLTVLEHELGHLQGLPHVAGRSGLMSPSFDPGTRRDLPDVVIQAGAAPVEANDGGTSDEERLLDGLGTFATWAENFGTKIQATLQSVPRIPFVDADLAELWNVTGGAVTRAIDQQIHDTILAVFEGSSKPAITTADLLALRDSDGAPILRQTVSTNAREFETTLTLASFDEDLALDLSGIDILGLDIPLDVKQSEPLRLHGDLRLGFTFGLDDQGQFYVRNPALTGAMSLDHVNPIDISASLGPLGVAIDDGRVQFQARMSMSSAGRLTAADMANDATGALIQSPSLGGDSSYQVSLPIVLQGALAGLSSEPIIVTSAFNSETDPLPVPSGASIKGFFDSIAENLTTEGLDALSSLRGVSLDGLLDGLSDLLDGWAQPDGPAFRKIPVIDKSLVELLGSGEVNQQGEAGFIAGFRAAIDDVRATLRSGSNLQRFERDLNYELARRLDLPARLPDRSRVDRAYDALVGLSPDLNATSTDSALAAAVADVEVQTIAIDATSGSFRITVDGRTTEAIPVVRAPAGVSDLATVDGTLITALRADRDLVAADAPFAAALARLASLGLSADSTDAMIDAAVGTTGDAAAVRSSRDLVVMADATLRAAADRLAARGLDAGSDDAAIDASVLAAARGVALSTGRSHVQAALAALSGRIRGLVSVDGDGTASSPWRIAFLGVAGVDLAQLSVDAGGLVKSGGVPKVDVRTVAEGGRFMATVKDRDFVGAVGRLSALGLDGDSTDADIAGALADPVLLASLLADRDLLAAHAAVMSASRRLASLGLDGDSTDAAVAAALDNAADIELAKAARATISEPKPADDEAGRLRYEVARNFLRARGLSADPSSPPSDAQIATTLDNTRAIADATADRDVVRAVGSAVRGAADRLAAYGLDGDATDVAIANRIVEPARAGSLRGDRDLVASSDLDPAAATGRLAALGLESGSSDSELAYRIADPVVTAAFVAHRDTLAAYQAAKVLGFAYENSAISVTIALQKHVAANIPFALDLQDLAALPGVPDAVRDLIGGGGQFSLDADATGVISIDASVDMDLGFTIDLGDVTAPKMFLEDTSRLSLDLTSASTSPLHFGGAIGVNVPGIDPFTVGVTVDGGSFAVDAHVDFAMQANADGSGRYLFADLKAAKPYDLAVSGNVEVDLPLFFPTPDRPMGGSQEDRDNDGHDDNVLHASADFAPSGLENVVVVTPSLKGSFDLFKLLDDPKNILVGLDLMFKGFKEQFFERFGQMSLPLIANEMDRAAGFVTDLRDDLLGIVPVYAGLPWNNPARYVAGGLGDSLLRGSLEGRSTVDLIRQALFEKLGAVLVVPLKNADGTPMFDGVGNRAHRPVASADDIQVALSATGLRFNVLLADTIFHKTVPLDFAVATPGLELSTAGAAVDFDLSYVFSLGFGLENGLGFFVDTMGATDEGAELALTLSATLGATTSVDATLGYLQVRLTEMTGVNGAAFGVANDTDGRSGLVAVISLDLVDANQDGRWFVKGESLSVVADLHAEADVDLGVRMSFPVGGKIALPTMTAVLHYDQTFADLRLASGTGSTVALGGAPLVVLENVTMDLGSALSGLVAPIAKEINKVIGQGSVIRDIVDLLTRPVDLGITSFTLLDIAGLSMPAPVLNQAKQALRSIQKFGDFYQQVQAALNSGGTIAFGDFTLAGSVLSTKGSAIQAGNVQGASTPNLQGAGGSQAANNVVKQFGTTPGSLQFPLLQDPMAALGFFMGRDIDLFNYTLPSLNIGFNYHQSYPVFPGLNAVLDGGVSVKTDIGFGLTTRGIRAWQAGGFQIGDIDRVFNGFYLADWNASGQERPEVTFSATIKAGASLGVSGLVEGGVVGGIEAGITLDVADVTPDGRVYFDEIQARAANSIIDVFDVHGQMRAFLEAFLWIGLDIGIARITVVDERKRFVDSVLAEFNHVARPAAPPPAVTPPPARLDIASLDAGVLTLRYDGPGGDASHDYSLEYVDSLDLGDLYQYAGTLTPLADKDASKKRLLRDKNGRDLTSLPADAGYVVVKSRATVEVYRASEVGVIRTLGTAGDDRYVISPRVVDVVPNISISTQAGADIVDLGGDYGVVLPGTLTRSITVDGGSGDDSIKGSSYADLLIGGTGNDTIRGYLGDDVIYGATPASAVNGASVAQGGGGGDILVGGAGADRIVGGDGADRIFGDFDDATLPKAGVVYGDTIDAGSGDDVVMGGFDADVVHGADGNDRLEGGTGDDWLFGDAGRDLLLGGAGDDALEGGSGADRLEGGEGNDTLHGGADRDSLVGGTGADGVFGDGGDDHIAWAIGDGADLDVQGGEGDDVLEIVGLDGVADSIAVLARGPGLSIAAGGSFTAMAFESLLVSPGSGADRLSVGDLATTTIRDVRVDYGRREVKTAKPVTIEGLDDAGMPRVVQRVFSPDDPLEPGQSVLATFYRLLADDSFGSDEVFTPLFEADGTPRLVEVLVDGISCRVQDVAEGIPADVGREKLGIAQTRQLMASRTVLRQVYDIQADGSLKARLDAAGRPVIQSFVEKVYDVDGDEDLATIDGASGADDFAVRTARDPDLDELVVEVERAGGITYSIRASESGRDRLAIDAGGGDDRVDASGVKDRLLATLSLLGGGGDDTLIGSPFPDVIDGGFGDDSLTGGAGVDTFADAGGIDTLVERVPADVALFGDAIIAGALVPGAVDTWQSGAEAEVLPRRDGRPILEVVRLTASGDHGRMVVNDDDGVVRIGGMSVAVRPFDAAAVLENLSTGRPAEVPYVIHTSSGGGADVVVSDPVNALTPRGLEVRGRPADDVVEIDASGDAATVAVGMGTPDRIHYDGGRLALLVSTGAGGDAVTVVNTPVGWATAIDTGSDADTVSIRGIGAALAVATGIGDDRVTVGSVAPASGGTLEGIVRRLSVEMGAGVDALVLDDTGDATGNSGVLTSSEVSGLGLGGGIGYAGVETLEIGLGSGGDAFTVRSTAAGASTTVRTYGGDDVVTVESTGGALVVTTGVGRDTVHVLSTSAGLTVATGTDADTVNIRSVGGATTVATGAASDTIRIGSLAPSWGGTVDGIVGRVSVDAGAGADVLSIDDTGDATANTGRLSAAEVGGLGMGGGIGYANVESLEIGLGSGDDTFSVLGSAAGATTTVSTRGGDDRVIVGTSDPKIGGTVNGVLGRLLVDAGSGSDRLEVDETGDGAANTGALSATEVTGLGLGAGLGYTGVESLSISLGGGSDAFAILSTGREMSTVVRTQGGDDRVTVTSTGGATAIETGVGRDDVAVESVGWATAIDTGSDADTVSIRGIGAALAVATGIGDDRVTVGSVAPASGGTLEGIVRRLSVEMGAGVDALVLDDTGDATGNSGVLTSSEVSGLGLGGGIGYAGVETLEIGLGSGGDAFTVRSTAAGASTTVRTYGGDDVVSLGHDGITAGIAGDVTIDAGRGSANRLVVDDSASGVGATTILTASSITGLSGGTAAVTYRATGGAFTHVGGDGIVVRSGRMASRHVVRSTLAGSTTRVVAGAEGNVDTIVVGDSATAAAGGVLSGIAGRLSLGNARGRSRIEIDAGGDAAVRSMLLDTIAEAGFVFGRLTGAGNNAPIEWTTGGVAGRNEIDSVLMRLGTVASTLTIDQSLPVGSGAPLAYVVAGSADGDRLIVRALSANATYDLRLVNGSLVGPDAGMVWNLSAADRGTMEGLPLGFAGVRHLIGGAGRDVFRFVTPAASVSGSIDGGAGVNWLDYSALTTAVTVRLNTGVVSAVGGRVSSIDNVLGSSVGGDVIHGTDRGGVLVARLKNNLVQAGAGRTILIGGNGRNTLVGNSADDLIIDGRTAYDADLTALETLRATWLDAGLGFQIRAGRIFDPRQPTSLQVGKTLFLAPLGPAGANPRLLVGGGGRTVYVTADARRIATFHARWDRLVR